MAYYCRKSPRIPNYDYSNENYYFITICTHNGKCYFGKPGELSDIGAVAQRHILEVASHYRHVSVDKYVVMPNHVHMILILHSANEANAEQIIGQYKAGVTREIRKIYPDIRLWQRSFYDNIIRNQKSYENIWLYIDANPQNWHKDCFYTKFT